MTYSEYEDSAFFLQTLEDTCFDIDFISYKKYPLTFLEKKKITIDLLIKQIEILKSLSTAEESDRIDEYNRMWEENIIIKDKYNRLESDYRELKNEYEDIKIKNNILKKEVYTLSHPTIDQIAMCCSLFMTIKDITNLFHCHHKVIDEVIKKAGYAEFKEFFDKYSEEGRISIRKAQFISATEDRNPAMLKFLGINYLGQNDSQKIEIKKIGYDNGLLMLNDQKLDFFRLSNTEFEMLTKLIEKAKVPAENDTLSLGTGNE